MNEWPSVHTFTSGSHSSGLLRDLIEIGEVEPKVTRRCLECNIALEWFGEWHGIVRWHDNEYLLSPDRNRCASCYRNRLKVVSKHD